MIISLVHSGNTYSVDLSKPIDISYPLVPDESTPKCFWAPDVSAVPVRAEGFVGSTSEGGAVNFYNVQINPHGNGTHTECVGHIAKVQHSVQESFDQYHFIAKLVSIIPEQMPNGDRVITEDQIISALGSEVYEAIIIRTLPNSISEKKIDYSNTNPPFIEADCMAHIRNHGIRHLLLDLPSVDKEDDGGRLSAHKAFWNYPEQAHDKRTITEMVFIDNKIADGLYLLEMQIAPLVLDASPSRPVLYSLTKTIN